MVVIFRIIDHFDAVKLLKESREFLIVANFSPYGNNRTIHTLSIEIKHNLYSF